MLILSHTFWTICNTKRRKNTTYPLITKNRIIKIFTGISKDPEQEREEAQEEKEEEKHTLQEPVPCEIQDETM